MSQLDFDSFVQKFMEDLDKDSDTEALNEATGVQVGDHIQYRGGGIGRGYGTVTKVGNRDIKFDHHDPVTGEKTGGTDRINHSKNDVEYHKISVTPQEHAANTAATKKHMEENGLQKTRYHSSHLVHNGKEVTHRIDKETGKLVPHSVGGEADEALKHPLKTDLSAHEHHAAANKHEEAAQAHRKASWDMDDKSHHEDMAEKHKARVAAHRQMAKEAHSKELASRGEHKLDHTLQYSPSSWTHEQKQLADAHKEAASYHTANGNHEMAGKHSKRAILHQNVHDTLVAHEAARKALQDSHTSDDR